MSDLNAKLIPLKSEVAGRVPTGAQVDVGEIAVNLTDRKIFSKRSDGTVVVLAGGSKIQDSEDFRPDRVPARYETWSDVNSSGGTSPGQHYYNSTLKRLTVDKTADGGENVGDWLATFSQTRLFVRFLTDIAGGDLTWHEVETTSNADSSNDWAFFFPEPFALWKLGGLQLARVNPDTDTDIVPLSDWDLLRFDTGYDSFVAATPDELWDQLSKNLEDLNNVSAEAPNEGDGLIWDASLEQWKPARLPSIELIERQVPSYRWTLAPGANPAEGEYRVAADGLNLNQIDADGNNLANWFGYYPDDSGNYWWSTDDLNWNQATYTSKNDDGSHLRIFSSDVLPPNPTVIYIALGQPNTVEQLPLNEGDLIQWDGDAWVPISINDLVVDITQFSIGDLKDVDTTTSPPTSGQVLTWNDTQQKWVPAQAAQGKNNFYELNDVSVGGVQDGQLVAWNFSASAWVPIDPPTSEIGQAPDFELNTQPAPSARYLRNENISESTPGAGTWSVPNTWTAAFALVDADGQDNTAAITAFVAAVDANGSAPLWTRGDPAGEWTQSDCSQAYADDNHVRVNQVSVSGPGPEPDFPYYVSFTEPGEPLPIALADGDVLVYSNGKWRPKQEALLEVDLGRYLLDDLGDVDATTVPPQVGEALLWDGTKWLPGAVEGGGGGTGGGWMGNRSDDTVTTTTLAQGGGTDDTVVFLEMGQSGQFVSITVDQPAWVRLYASATDRTNDADRQLNTDPLPGSGVLLEVLTSTENETVPITPGAVYYNNDPLPASKIYARVSNYSTAEQPITVTVTCIAQTFFDVISGGSFGSGF